MSDGCASITTLMSVSAGGWWAESAAAAHCAYISSLHVQNNKRRSAAVAIRLMVTGWLIGDGEAVNSDVDLFSV